MSTTPTLYPFQVSSSRELKFGLLNRKSPAQLLLSGTGTGKTFILAEVIRAALADESFWANFKGPFKVFYITKASVVTQTLRVLNDFGIRDDIFVTNYDQLRSQLGSIFITTDTVVKLGEAQIEFNWKPGLAPRLIIWDECQALKNADTHQTDIAQAYSKLNINAAGKLQPFYQIFASATPFTRLSEAETFCVAARIPHKFGYITSPLTKDHWLDFATSLCAARADITDYSPQSMSNLRNKLREHNLIIEPSGIKFAHIAKNHCKLIDFACAEDAYEYKKAYEDYLAELAKIDRYEPGGIAALWVADLKFRQRAELIRAPYLADMAHDIIIKDNRAVIIASNFIKTLEVVYRQLIEIHGYKPEEISFITGKNLAGELNEKGQLPTQTVEQRQDNIDRFQSGRSKICLFTLKAGGIGLSLHHDRPGLLPRTLIIPPTWSAIELIQSLGRAHRINSLSTTDQYIIFYRGTVEEQVAAKVEMKLRSLKELITRRETWHDLFASGEQANSALALSEREQIEFQQKFLEESSDNGDITDIDDNAAEGMLIEV